MEQELAALKRLQRIDQQLSQRQSQKEHLPQRLAAAQQDVQDRQEQRRQVEQQLQSRRLEIDRQELDLRSHEERGARLRQQLNQVRTNREYQALLTEIKSVEADVSRLEEAILEAMGEADELAAEQARLADLIQETQREVTAVGQAVSEEAGALEGQIASLSQDRQEVAVGIDPENLATYERLRRGLGGRVVVPVRNDHCEGCHMPLTPQTISELLANRALVVCHRCGLILYLQESAEPAEPQG